MICRAWASPHQQSDVRKLSSGVPEEADLPCFCYIELFWFCPSRHCWNQHIELSWLNWQKPVNMYLYIFKGWWCSCRQSIAIVIFRCDWNFVPFHFFSLYFPAQKTSTVLLLMDKNVYILRQHFIHSAIEEFNLCFELSMIFSFCFLKSQVSYCYGLTVAWPSLERPKTFTGKCYLSLKRRRCVRAFKLPTARQSMYLANGPWSSMQGNSGEVCSGVKRRCSDTYVVAVWGVACPVTEVRHQTPHLAQ